MRDRTLVALGCVALALPLAAHAYAGTAARYVGDDYCAGYIFKEQGLLGGQRWFYRNWGAVPTVLALMALTERGGPHLAPWLPSIAVVAWVAALVWAIRWITAAAGTGWDVASSLLAAEAVIFVTLQDAPNIIQSLYLRVPMLAYTGPLIALSVYAGFLARAAVQRRATAAHLVASALLAFVGGSFGPVFVAMQTTALAAAAVMNAIWNRGSSRAALQRLFIAGVIGSVAALAVVALAPGNAARQQAFPKPPSLWLLIKWSLLSSVFMFIRPVLPLLRGAIAAMAPRVWGVEPAWFGKALEMASSPFTIVLLVAVAASLALARETENRDATRRQMRAILAGAPVLAFVLVVSAIAPGAYGTSAPPPPRALVIPQFAMASLAMVWGYALGVWLRPAAPALRSRARTAAAAVASVLIVTLSIASARTTLSRAHALQTWAARWDEVDGALRAAHDAGRREALVPAIGDIGGVGAIAVDPDDWVNACAARYYGLDRIRGVVRR